VLDPQADRPRRCRSGGDDVSLRRKWHIFAAAVPCFSCRWAVGKRAEQGHKRIKLKQGGAFAVPMGMS